jgi:hypothetical protein
MESNFVPLCNILELHITLKMESSRPSETLVTYCNITQKTSTWNSIQAPVTSPWRWRQQGPPKHWCHTTSLHGVTTQRTATRTLGSFHVTFQYPVLITVAPFFDPNSRSFAGTKISYPARSIICSGLFMRQFLHVTDDIGGVKPHFEIFCSSFKERWKYQWSYAFLDQEPYLPLSGRILLCIYVNN